jgi:seryl-tRNA synthetase
VSDLTNDIDALLAALDWGPGALTNEEMLDRSHAALTALIAERDALKKERQMYWESCDALEKQNLDLSATLNALVAERDALKARVAELAQELKSRNEAYEELRWRIVEKSWSQPPADRDRDLRGRLVCAALTRLCADPRYDFPEEAAIAIADRALAAMRKGEA